LEGGTAGLVEGTVMVSAEVTTHIMLTGTGIGLTELMVFIHERCVAQSDVPYRSYRVDGILTLMYSDVL
jgi:hypothetical protein